jgi:AhpD family alkylhydroperoxidase
MQNYPIHTISSAPEGSQTALKHLQQAFGAVPNLVAAIANSLKLINSLIGVFQQVHNSSLTEPEIQIVLLTDAVANSCTYAVAFHTALAVQQGVSSEETAAIREQRAPTDKRFAALSALAKTLIEKRGHLSDQELDAFISAGFTKEQILDVIAVVAASTITNYAGTIANRPRYFLGREAIDSIQLADFNHDGKLDLFASNGSWWYTALEGANSFAVLLNQPAVVKGTLTTSPQPSLAGKPYRHSHALSVSVSA